MYAAGKFPGGFMKREGRPSTDATLTARLIDRPIRPMFAEGFRNEVKLSTPSFLTMKMHLHQWLLCLVHPWHFLFQIFPFDGPICWGTGGLCRWPNHHQP